jgi:predicted homoserine dehydrogenase-like protein
MRPVLRDQAGPAEVGAQTKRAMKAGERIDGIGGSTVRGHIEASADFAAAGRVPLGVLVGATLVSDVPVDHTLTYEDVQVDESLLIVRMRRIQEAMDDTGADVPDLAALRSALVA